MSNKSRILFGLPKRIKCAPLSSQAFGREIESDHKDIDSVSRSANIQNQGVTLCFWQLDIMLNISKCAIEDSVRERVGEAPKKLYFLGLFPK